MGYEAPKITTVGSVSDLTRAIDGLGAQDDQTWFFPLSKPKVS